MTHPGWNYACELKLESDRIPNRSDYERWAFVMLDGDGNEVYREDITDPALLRKNTHTVLVRPLKAAGVPVRYFLWPRLADRTFTEKYHFPLPASFTERNREVFQWIRDTPIPGKTVTCDIFGGLGNQLFQIMTTMVFARRNGYMPIFDVGMKESPSMLGKQPTYWDGLFKQLVAESRRCRCDFREQKTWPDPSFTYHPIPQLANHMRLSGHFLSFRYFDDDYEYVSTAVRTNEEISRQVTAVFDELMEAHGLGSRSLVSVHVRRGDALKNATLEEPGPEYYRQAQARFENADFLVFSDDHDWCRANLGEACNRHPVRSSADYVDLLLMSKCDHHIIANSTFSWWAAYLNPSPRKRVVYPYPWFRGGKHARDFRDFIPPGWVAVQS